MDKSSKIKLALATLSAVVGAVLLAITVMPSDPEKFDGSVTIVPGQEGVDLAAIMDFHPEESERPTPGQPGEISVTLFNDHTEGNTKTHWFIFLVGDAMLRNARLVSQFEKETESIQGTTFDAPWVEGKPSEFQVFEFDAAPGTRLIGTPERSPVSGGVETQNVTMPRIYTLEPEEGPERNGGVLFEEYAFFPLLLANPQRLPLAVQGDWYPPRTRRLTVGTGFSESSEIRVEQAVPDLDRNTWGSLIRWRSDIPVAASATLSNPGASNSISMLSAVSFLFLGAAMPLLFEVLVSRSTAPVSQHASGPNFRGAPATGSSAVALGKAPPALLKNPGTQPVPPTPPPVPAIDRRSRESGVERGEEVKSVIPFLSFSSDNSPPALPPGAALGGGLRPASALVDP